jgi:TonB-dependent receptor
LGIDTPNGGLDPSLMLTGGASFRNSFMDANIKQTDLRGVWDMSDSMSLDFGITDTEADNRSAFSNVQYDNWGGIGSPDDFPDDLWQIRDVRSLFDNVSGSGNPLLFNQMFIWDFEAVRAIAEETRGQTLSASDDFTTDRTTLEDTLSAYFQWRWAFDIGSMPSNLRVGIRYEDTDVTSSALVPIATDIRWAAENEFSVVFGSPDFTTLEGSYDYWLPNLDWNLSVTDNLVVRASYSETIGRPGWGDIQGGQTLNQLARIDGGTGQQGDPGLLPLESANYDVSVEWYYGEGSYFSVGYFFKDVDNYVGITTITDTPFDLFHPAQGPWFAEADAATGGTGDLTAIRQYIFETYGDSPFVEITGTDTNGNFTGFINGQPGDAIATFDITVPANQQSVEIDGFEIALQHLFGESGFGVIANYTAVDSDAAYDNASRDDQFAIEGLSDSANLIAFYDNYGWQARLAYNWRDEFLSARFDPSGLPNPVYTEEYGQLDALVSYTFEKQNLTLFLEGFNLTDEYQRLKGRAQNQAVFVTQTGARYGIGVRWIY